MILKRRWRKIDYCLIEINFKNWRKWKDFCYDCFEIIQWNEFKWIFKLLQCKIAKINFQRFQHALFLIFNNEFNQIKQKICVVDWNFKFSQRFIYIIKSKIYIFLTQISNLIAFMISTIFCSIVFWTTIAIFFVAYFSRNSWF